ncbi:MAG: hypothetical protein HZR80_19045 [Candidatus Heimdallarchaeota archaeon]
MLTKSFFVERLVINYFFVNPNDQLDALSYFKSIFDEASEHQKEMGKEVIELLIQILKESKKAKVRLKVAKVLGDLGIKSELVLPALERAIWLDNFYQFFFSFFGSHL